MSSLPGATVQALESRAGQKPRKQAIRESHTDTYLGIKCDPKDKRLCPGKGHIAYQTALGPNPPVAPEYVDHPSLVLLQWKPREVGLGLLPLLVCQRLSPPHIFLSCYQLEEQVALAWPRGALKPSSFPAAIQVSLLCSRQVHFERTQTLPVRGHQVGRRPLRKRQSLPRTLLRYPCCWWDTCCTTACV